MKASISTVSFSTASSDASISQEILCLKEYDLAIVINQFPEFRDDFKPDIDEEVLKNVDQDDSLFVSNHDEDLENFPEDFFFDEFDSEFNSESDSESDV